MGKRISLEDKQEIVRYHKLQANQDPHHKQTDTIKYFQDRFTITKSSLNRWLLNDAEITKYVNPKAKPRRSGLVASNVRADQLNHNDSQMNSQEYSSDAADDSDVSTDNTFYSPAVTNNNSSTVPNSLAKGNKSPQLEPEGNKTELKQETKPGNELGPRNDRQSNPDTGIVDPEKSSHLYINPQNYIHTDKFRMILGILSEQFFLARALGSDIEYDQRRIKRLLNEIKHTKKIPIPYLSSVVFECLRVDVLEQLWYQQVKVEETNNTLSKESERFKRASKGFHHDHVYQFAESSIDINDLIEYKVPGGKFVKKNVLTLGVGFNYSGTEFLPPYIISNFSEYGIKNHDGFSSNFTLKEYLRRLDNKFKEEKKRALLIFRKSPTTLMFNEFSNITMLYTKHRILPASFGLQALFIKNVKMLLLDFILRGFHVKLLPLLTQIIIEDLFIRFEKDIRYKRFLLHCIKLSINDWGINNFLRLINSEVDPELFHYNTRKKHLILNCNETFLSQWTRLVQLGVLNVLDIVLPHEYVFLSIMDSNLCQIVEPRKENVIQDFLPKIEELINFRYLMFQSEQITAQTVTLFDQFFECFYHDLTGMNHVFGNRTYKEDYSSEGESESSENGKESEDLTVDVFGSYIHRGTTSRPNSEEVESEPSDVETRSPPVQIQSTDPLNAMSPHQLSQYSLNSIRSGLENSESRKITSRQPSTLNLSAGTSSLRTLESHKASRSDQLAKQRNANEKESAESGAKSENNTEKESKGKEITKKNKENGHQNNKSDDKNNNSQVSDAVEVISELSDSDGQYHRTRSHGKKRSASAIEPQTFMATKTSRIKSPPKTMRTTPFSSDSEDESLSEPVSDKDSESESDPDSKPVSPDASEDDSD